MNINPKNHTDVEAVKRANANSGMSYNEAKEYIAKTTGGHNTKQFSNTDSNAIRQKLNNNN